MPLIVTEKHTSSMEPIPAGVHIGICYSVVDLGTHINATYGVEQRKVLVSWELPGCLGEFEQDGETVELPRVVSKRYTLSLSEKAILRKDLESWRGRRFTPSELAGFNLEVLIGLACQIQIVHAEGKDGRTFGNVSCIMALPKGASDPGKAQAPMTFFSLDDLGEEPELPDLPQWIKGIIVESNEWKALTTPEPVVTPQDKNTETGEEEDNDVPF